ncbi:exosortase [Pseudocolwellia agarivorans]|uniref:exosortase n=1 Tax=Pseudocolwellia agarivorans TaxID=1911682 RepID=UPI0009845F8F|nr:exosortase [Pseudocolwellia agarivorans]
MNIPNNYKPFVGVVLLFAIISLLNIPLLATLWRHSFDDGTYSHAYLIPFIVLYLYFKLSEIGKLVYRDKLSSLSIVMLLVSGGALFVTSNAQISIGFWLSFLAIAVAGIHTLFRFNWYVIFPACFLIFIFPLWGLLTNILQDISVIAVTYMMSFTNIPTYVEAQYITIPSGVFEIADGCSGLRYIIVSLAISSLFIFLYINNIKKALIFLSIAILGALITNWIRITALILIGDYTEMQSSLMEDHNTFGWYLYIPFMFLLFMWGNKLANHDLLSDTPNNIASASSVYPARVNTLILFVTIIISSTTLKSLFLNDLSSSTEISEIKPIIKRYTTVEQISSSTANTPDIYLKYFFNGTLDNGKPTAHDNIYIPLGWHSINQEIIGSWMYVTISNKEKTALIRYSFEINNQKRASSGSFKKLRILETLKGNSETYLYWQYSDCSNRCDQKKKLLQQLN